MDKNCSLLYLYSHILELLTDELSRRTSEGMVGPSAAVCMGVQNANPAFPSQSLIYTDLTNDADERQSQCFSYIWKLISHSEKRKLISCIPFQHCMYWEMQVRLPFMWHLSLSAFHPPVSPAHNLLCWARSNESLCLEEAQGRWENINVSTGKDTTSEGW